MADRTIPEALDYWMQQVRFGSVMLSMLPIFTEDELERARQHQGDFLHLPPPVGRQVVERTALASVYGSMGWSLVNQLKEHVDGGGDQDHALSLALNALTTMLLYVAYVYRDWEIGITERKYMESYVRGKAQTFLRCFTGDHSQCQEGHLAATP